MCRAQHGCPLFAFAFRGGQRQSLHDFAEADVASGNADFCWVHLDLSDAAAQAWLRRRAWSPDVIEMTAAPIQRGRLFITPDLVYGHLRDFRDEPNAVTLQAGSVCVVASRTLLVTGRRIPLRSIEELRSRVEARTIIPESPFGLITEFFRALNDIGEGLLQEATERLIAMESKVLKRSITGSRGQIFEMRRESIRVARDMAYKRTAMLELTHERPVLLSVDEFDRFNRQIHRYAALVEDAEEYHNVLSNITAGNANRKHLGHERRRHSVWRQPKWILGGRRADSGGLRLGGDRPLPVQVQVLLRRRRPIAQHRPAEPASPFSCPCQARTPSVTRS
ncbi:MAG TPA: CorA family divalent cation transporter [Stellaceae bacterium]